MSKLYFSFGARHFERELEGKRERDDNSGLKRFALVCMIMYRVIMYLARTVKTIKPCGAKSNSHMSIHVQLSTSFELRISS